MSMLSLLSVCSLHIKEVGSSIATASADHFHGSTSTSTNNHIWSEICIQRTAKLLIKETTENERETKK